jgi:hypothetical protein
MLVTEGRVIPGIEIVRRDGSVASMSTHTVKDEQVAGNGNFGPSLEEISRVKQMLAIDASDGTIDFHVNGLKLESPRYTIFWTENSAAALLLGLASGDRKLRVNGREVEVPQSFKTWVDSQRFLERAPGGGAPVGG